MELKKKMFLIKFEMQHSKFTDWNDQIFLEKYVTQALRGEKAM